MTYRLRCKRAERTKVIRKKPGCTLDAFDAMMKRAWPQEQIDGEFELPTPGFTPNENWEPRRTSLFFADRTNP